MASIHQFLAGFSLGDAISNEALVLRRIFRSWGYSSEIFSEANCIHPGLASEAADLSAADVSAEDTVILHLSIGSAVNDRFAELRCRKVILYHNITPHRYFSLVNPRSARLLELGRNQLVRLAGTAEVNIADSAYNARELAAAGYRAPRVFPIVIDFSVLAQPPDPSVARKWNDGATNILFVGRCAPNKKIEDVILVFHHYNKFVNPHSRLILAGSYVGTERYYHLLLAMVRELQLDNVCFTGPIKQPLMNAAWSTAHAFVCMSEHEGFCIPLLESMFFNVPVLALDAGAVSETLDGAGVLMKRSSPAHAAEMLGRIINDMAFRTAILAGQAKRLERFRSTNVEENLRSCLTPVLK